MKIKVKQILYVGAFIVLTLIGYIFLPRDEIVIDTKDNHLDCSDFLGGSGNKENVKTIYVHIEGAVKSPGIKEIPENTRLFELIKLAEGADSDADLSKLNLASVLKDEQKIYVPYKVEITENDTGSKQIGSIESNNKIYSYNELININIASSDELQQLDGIGPAMAQKILNYREINGYFSSIEDIKNVSGIGEAKFNKIKDNITI